MNRELILASVVALSACQSSSFEHGGDPRPPPTLLIDGSTALYPAVSASAEQFMRVHPGTSVSVERSSSGTGLARLIAGDIDIATSARAPLPQEFELAYERDIPLKTYQIAYDALAIVVHPDRYRYITGMTRDQAHAIFFAGSITDWSQLHAGASGAITPYVRDTKTSATATAAAEHLTGSVATPYTGRSVVLDFTPDVVRRVAGDRDGIGFAPMALADDSVRMLAFGDSEAELVQPTRQSVRDLRYRLRRDLFVVTRGTPVGTRNLFIQLLLDSQGQALLTAADLIPLQ